MLRGILKYLFVHALWLSGALWWARRRAMRLRAVAVLTLHRVVPDAEFETMNSLPGIVVRASTFAALVRHIRAHCTPISPSLEPAPHTPCGKPRVALTFDDGWADNGAVASAILDQYSVPALVFICPGLMGRTFPFWPERVIAARRSASRANWAALEALVDTLKIKAPAEREAIVASLPVPSESELQAREPLNATLTWEELPVLQTRGLSFGSHTYSHQILTHIPPENVLSELTESRIAIQTRLGGACDTLAYPNGNCSTEVRDAARAAGYRLAFTTRPGLWTSDSDSLVIPRVNISDQHLVGPSGRFSRAMFEYNVFWRGLRYTQPLTQ